MAFNQEKEKKRNADRTIENVWVPEIYTASGAPRPRTDVNCRSRGDPVLDLQRETPLNGKGKEMKEGLLAWREVRECLCVVHRAFE